MTVWRSARRSSVVAIIPAPSGPSSHLWPSATTASTPRALRCIGSTPSPWMPSTMQRTPRSRHRRPSWARGAIQPVWKATHDTASSLVRSPMCSSTTLGSMRPSGCGNRTTLTPRCSRASQGETLAANSSLPTRTSSPSLHLRPWAMSDRPSDVLRMIEMSCGVHPASWLPKCRQLMWLVCHSL